MRPRPRCSIPAAAGPKPVNCSLMRATTTDHGAAPTRRSLAYVYAPDRKAVRPIAHLAGFHGVLQVDGYAGYKVLAERRDGGLPSVGPMSAATFTNSPRAA